MARGRIIYTGNFLEYFLWSLLLLLLSIVTLGLGAIYWAYWTMKYFFINMEIEMDPDPEELSRSDSE